MSNAELEPSPKEESQGFPKGLLFLIILCIAMAFTNPTKTEYVSWAKEQSMAQNSNNALASGMISLFGNSIIDSATTSKSYFLFSIFTTNLGGNQNNQKVIGLFHNFIPMGNLF